MILAGLLLSCQGRQHWWQKVDPGDNVEVVQVLRYEQALDTIDPVRFAEGISNLRSSYAVFLGDKPPDSAAVRQLQDYLQDPFIRELYHKTNERYPDLKGLEVELTESFRYYTWYFPGIPIPAVYTYISGLDAGNRIMVGPDALLIAIDMYLGPDYEPYKQLGLPVYQIERFSREYLARDCMVSLLEAQTGQVYPGDNLLERMVHEGKKLWFLDAVMPGLGDGIKIGYTKEQLQWCVDNQSNLWKFILNNEILYSTDVQVINKFMMDGPFTRGFEGSPSRLGAWIGWQIVRAYMDKKPEGSMPELFRESEARRILVESGYKPEK